MKCPVLNITDEDVRNENDIKTLDMWTEKLMAASGSILLRNKVNKPNELPDGADKSKVSYMMTFRKLIRKRASHIARTMYSEEIPLVYSFYCVCKEKLSYNEFNALMDEARKRLEDDKDY